MCLVTDINECTLGLAKCRPVEECVNTDGSYVCKDTCPPGYKRNDAGACVDVDECRELMPCHPDQNCINLVGSYKCFCQPGFVSLGVQGPCQGRFSLRIPSQFRSSVGCYCEFHHHFDPLLVFTVNSITILIQCWFSL